MSTFGESIKISLFGESHGPLVGITIHHLPAGLPLDIKHLSDALKKRSPQSSYETARRESDHFEIVSGYHNGKTTGTPLTFMIKNSDPDSTKYTKGLVRPAHGDFPAYHKFGSYHDHRGGGHFSGRLTAPIILLGEVCKSALAHTSIKMMTHILSLHKHKSISFLDKDIGNDTFQKLMNSGFPVLEDSIKETMKDTLVNISKQGDSVGGTLETIVKDVPIGWGEPFFDGLDSMLGHLLFSIPSVKGVAFGRGFELSTLLGSEANDPISYKNHSFNFHKNDMGGLLAGFSSGQPIVIRTAFKPVPTINKTQKTVNVISKETIDYSFEGRHDSCAMIRAIPIVNALTWYALLEMKLRNEGLLWKP